MGLRTTGEGGEAHMEKKEKRSKKKKKEKKKKRKTTLSSCPIQAAET